MTMPHDTSDQARSSPITHSTPDHWRHPAFWPAYGAALTAIFARISIPGDARTSDGEVLALGQRQIELANEEADLMAVIVVEHYQAGAPSDPGREPG